MMIMTICTLHATRLNNIQFTNSWYKIHEILFAVNNYRNEAVIQ